VWLRIVLLAGARVRIRSAVYLGWIYVAVVCDAGWLQFISALIPLSHLTDMFRKMALMGADLQYLWPHIAVLVAWLPVSIVWGYWGLRRQTGAAA
jgi:ABC-type multidrug transport system permease subunit